MWSFISKHLSPLQIFSGKFYLENNLRTNGIKELTLSLDRRYLQLQKRQPLLAKRLSHRLSVCYYGTKAGEEHGSMVVSKSKVPLPWLNYVVQGGTLIWHMQEAQHQYPSNGPVSVTKMSQ